MLPLLSSSAVADSISGALIAAVIAAAGYVGKLLLDLIINLRKTQRSRRAHLVQLKSLLHASRASFEIQNQQAQRLLKMLETRKGITADAGYEQAFSSAYVSFTAQEKELHTMIRAMTVYALKPTNAALLNWIQDDEYFRGQQTTGSTGATLAAALAQLQTHLLLWLAKYEIWIPNSPEHALVYLADEQEHGVGFPSGMDELVNATLERM